MAGTRENSGKGVCPEAGAGGLVEEGDRVPRLESRWWEGAPGQGMPTTPGAQPAPKAH